MRETRMNIVSMRVSRVMSTRTIVKGELTHLDIGSMRKNSINTQRIHLG